LYVYIKGQDDHFCFKHVKNRKVAEDWLDMELKWYSLVFTDIPDNGVLTNKEFYEKFPPEITRYCEYRRISRKLLNYIDETRKLLRNKK
jgi:hypothetical protein